MKPPSVWWLLIPTYSYILEFEFDISNCLEYSIPLKMAIVELSAPRIRLDIAINGFTEVVINKFLYESYLFVFSSTSGRTP